MFVFMKTYLRSESETILHHCLHIDCLRNFLGEERSCGIDAECISEIAENNPIHKFLLMRLEFPVPPIRIGAGGMRLRRRSSCQNPPNSVIGACFLCLRDIMSFSCA